jgi:hypothetical protein
MNMPNNMSEAYRVVMQLRDANKKKDNRIAELEKALDKLIDQASMCDSWECFPSDWLDEAYESLSKGGAN